MVLLIACGLFAKFAIENKGLILRNEWAQRMMPLYHSIRKIPDFPFIAYTAFSDSSLETFDLYISEENIARMNAVLSDAPFQSTLGEENKLWVSATFRAGDYNEQVKVRYRGDLGNHWNSYKKSYLIEFPNRNLFRGMKRLSLIIPYDRRYFGTSLNNYRARKMGLLVPQEFYVNMTFNGAKKGVYLAAESWTQEWLEKNPVSALSKIVSGPDPVDMERLIGDTTGDFSAYLPSSQQYWKIRNTDEDPALSDELLILLEILNHASDEEFEQLAPLILDLEAFYAQDTLNILAGAYHLYDNGNNIIMLFDATEGRFKPIPYNVSLARLDSRLRYGVHELRAPVLQRRIWSIPAFRAARDAYFENYIIENRTDDIAYIENWIDTMKLEFYRDNAKLMNNFMFEKDLTGLYEAVQEHSNLTPSVLNIYEPVVKSTTTPLSIPDSFIYLLAAAKNLEDFLVAHPQFIKTEEGITLPPGEHYFTETVIVPRDTLLTIQPGAQLLLGNNVSFVSYSPIHAEGTSQNTIRVAPVKSGDTWGTFAVINTEDKKNVLRHATFEGGSEATINGVLFSGMVALHNTQSIIEFVTVADVRGEDGINAKGGSLQMIMTTVSNTFSDGIDLDYVDPRSLLSDNRFENIGGDAIDISWTNAPIANNVVTTCTDKGISVGERSEPILYKNTITKCDIGIAIKDQSNATIENNTLTENRLAVALYQKKHFFGGGAARLVDNLFINNQQSFFVDNASTYTEVNSTYKQE